METWEYLIVSPKFEPARSAQCQSPVVKTLNRESDKGWEVVGMTGVGDGTLAVLLERQAPPKPLRVNEP